MTKKFVPHLIVVDTATGQRYKVPAMADDFAYTEHGAEIPHEIDVGELLAHIMVEIKDEVKSEELVAT